MVEVISKMLICKKYENHNNANGGPLNYFTQLKFPPYEHNDNEVQLVSGNTESTVKRNTPSSI